MNLKHKDSGVLCWCSGHIVYQIRKDEVHAAFCDRCGLIYDVEITQERERLYTG